MRLIFKQRIFSWFDSYDIYDEAGNAVFTVKGRLAWGHCLEIFDCLNHHVGTVREEVLTFMPRFALYEGERYIGQIKKAFTLFKPVYTLDVNGWTVEGDLFGWDYRVTDGQGCGVMQASKELMRWSDTYVIDVFDARNSLLALMIVLAIDAANCSQGNG